MGRERRQRVAYLTRADRSGNHCPDADEVDEFTDADGGTWLEAMVTGRPTGLMRVLQPMIARTTQQSLDRAYPRLKRLLETGTPS